MVDGPLKGYLRYSTDPIVSSDIVNELRLVKFRFALTKVIGNQVKVVGWYDNEWGYSNRIVDLVGLDWRDRCRPGSSDPVGFLRSA